MCYIDDQKSAELRLAVVAVFQLIAICLPAILWLIDKRDSETGRDQ